MRRAVEEMLAVEVSDWFHSGLIEKELYDRLIPRYRRAGAGMAGLVKWLGIFAIICIASSVLTLLASMAESKFVGALMLGAVSYGSASRGVRIATAGPKNYPMTGAALVTVGMIAFYGMAALLTMPPRGFENAVSYFSLLYLTGALSAYLAYRYRMRWPLLFALFCLFHAFGSSTAYVGHGTYLFHVQDEKSMAVLAAIVTAFGVFHERRLERESLKLCAGFGSLYVKFGLLYLNTSLLIFTLRAVHGAQWSLVATMLLTAVTFAEIIIGARLKDVRFTGFGVVFLSLNIYTRFFEHHFQSWESAVLGLSGGLVLLFLGGLFDLLSQEAAKAEL